MRSARAPRSERDHRLPARLVSCLVSGSTCSLNMSCIARRASRSVCCMSASGACGPAAVRYAGTSSGSTSSRSTPSCDAASADSVYVVSRSSSRDAR